MEIIEISKANVLKAYEEGTKKQKELLINLTGNKNLFLKDVKDRIKSYEDACEALGFKPLSFSDFKRFDEKRDKHSFVAHQLETIVDALNEGFTFDWSNKSQAKYYPYFVFSGGSFAFYGYRYGYGTANVSSRLCFKSRELAEYAGKQFQSIYNQYLNY